MTQRFALALCGLLAPAFAVAVVTCAGALKLIDLPAFVAVLHSWKSVPPWLVPIAAVGVPVAECAAGVVWLIGRRDLAVGLAAVILVLVSAAFSLEVALHGPVHCGCLGEVFRFERRESEWRFTLARNALLLVALLPCALFKPGLSTSASATERRASLAGGRPAFTIIEALVVILMILIALALLSPSLGSTRDAARRVSSVSNLRQHGAIIAAYAYDARGVFPFVTDPRSTHTIIRGGGRQVIASFFDAKVWWMVALSDGYYDGARAHPSWFDPTSRLGNSDAYLYSATCFTAPEFWVAETRTGPDQWISVPVAGVRFPAAKGVLLGRGTTATAYAVHDESAPGATLEIGPADGSAASFQVSEVTRGFAPGEGIWGFPFGLRVLHTPAGVQGADLTR